MGDGVLVDVGVMVGRFNPLHVGHIRTIGKMALHHGNKCLLVIGSANAPCSLRNLFTYSERRDFIRKVFPDLKIVGLSDQPNDKDWFNSLVDIVEAVFPFYHQTVLYTGSPQDISNFELRDVSVRVVDRNTDELVSASLVRKCILSGEKQSLRSLVPESLLDLIFALGRSRMWQLIDGEL